MELIISPLNALILGIVEGVTEFLPVSSTGHLILAADVLGLDETHAGVKAFEIVIQAGALAAVVAFYFPRLRQMGDGLAGRSPSGLALLYAVGLAFLPAAFAGLLLGDAIKAYLFGSWPVIAALAIGGLAMIAVDLWRRGRTGGDELWGQRGLAQMTMRAAVIIGCAQCLAMWPGTSRSMTTIVAALMLGYSPKAAAEFSFLLALPTLGAATAHDALKEGGAIIAAAGWSGLAIGFFASMIVAWLAVKGFLAWLGAGGLWPFGVYRLVVAGAFAASALGFL